MNSGKYIIVHLVDTLFGGVASVVANLINEQHKHGFKTIVAYVYDDSAMDDMLDFKIEKIKVSLKTYPGYSMLFGMNVRSIYCDVKKRYPGYTVIVHAHNVQTVGLFARIKGIPIVCTLHSLRGEATGIRTTISDSIYRKILKKIMRTHGALSSVSYAIAEFYGRGKYDICVIHNGICSPYKRVKQSKFTIVHVGNISKAKGWDITCDAFSRIPTEIRKEMRFISAGHLRGYKENDIKDIFKEKGISDESCYLGFINKAGDLVIPKADILVLASKNEGLGLVLIEAMAQGIPVLGARTGGICEVIKDGYNGFFVNGSNEIANRIMQLYADTEKYMQLSKNALDTYREEFTSEKMHNRYIDLYKKVTDDKNNE